MRMSPMIGHSGRPVVNQYVIHLPHGRVFKSYDSLIVYKGAGGVFLGPDWDYSRTTGKYRNLFMGESINDIRRKIKSGDYKEVSEKFMERLLVSPPEQEDVVKKSHAVLPRKLRSDRIAA